MDDAKRIEQAVKNRFCKYGLETHPTKSRCITFGRYERQNAKTQGRKPNTFDFLGLTHFCDLTRSGKFKLGHKTQRKKYVKACKNMWEWLKLKAIRNLESAEVWWKTLAAKLRGHFNYYGISGNYPDINRFNFKILKMTRYWMNRKSQKQTQTVEKFWNYLERHPLPKPEIKHVIYVY